MVLEGAHNAAGVQRDRRSPERENTVGSTGRWGRCGRAAVSGRVSSPSSIAIVDSSKHETSAAASCFSEKAAMLLGAVMADG